MYTTTDRSLAHLFHCHGWAVSHSASAIICKSGILELHHRGVPVDESATAGTQVDDRKKQTLCWYAGWGWDKLADMDLRFAGPSEAEP